MIDTKKQLSRDNLIKSEVSCIKRYKNNPIITPADIPYPCKYVYNPAACRQGDDYILLLRVDQPGGTQCLGIARSKDGINFKVDPDPVMRPNEEEKGQLNDPRITFIDDWYYLTYCSDPQGEKLRNEGIYLCIARSKDLKNWERIYKSQPDNRNAVIFPEKINGNYVRLDRPFRRGYRQEAGYDIWLSESPDMRFWGNHKLLLSHYDVIWGSHKIGPAAPPVKTPEGWLVFFHGAFIPEERNEWKTWSCSNCKVYCAGVMLLDLEKPWIIKSIRKLPVLTPRTDYEMNPVYRPNVVFPCGVITEENGDMKIYYGASDHSIAVAFSNVYDLLRILKKE
jgi:beta-1,4-mannooligosaccharide/beta-1,4-mannosyl-N-acetylglucosamine phosphorylase